jgi:hypothetical protein
MKFSAVGDRRTGSYFQEKPVLKPLAEEQDEPLALLESPQ